MILCVHPGAGWGHREVIGSHREVINCQQLALHRWNPITSLSVDIIVDMFLEVMSRGKIAPNLPGAHFEQQRTR